MPLPLSPDRFLLTVFIKRFERPVPKIVLKVLNVEWCTMRVKALPAAMPFVAFVMA